MGRGKDVDAFLVGASGGNKFHVTAAGRDALKAARLKTVPRRFPVAPASALALELVKLADDGEGRVPKSMRKAVAKAELLRSPASSIRKAAEAAMRPQMRRQLERTDWSKHAGDMLGKKARGELIAAVKAAAGELLCTVDACGAAVGPGGRKASPAKCARCYQRERRGQPEQGAKATGEGRTESVTVQVTPDMKRRLEARAAVHRVSVSRLVEGWCTFNLGPGPGDVVTVGHLRSAMTKLIENNTKVPKLIDLTKARRG